MLILTMLEKAYMKVRGKYCHGSVPSDDMQILVIVYDDIFIHSLVGFQSKLKFSHQNLMLS